MSMYCWNVSSLCVKQYINNQNQTGKLKKCTINYIATIKLLKCFYAIDQKGAVKEWLNVFNPRKERKVREKKKKEWKTNKIIARKSQNKWNSNVSTVN